MTVAPKAVEEVKGARVLAVFGDSITTDHISPAGKYQAQRAGRRLSHPASRDPEGFQLLWLAPRQFRADGARYLRQYPHPQRDDGRREGGNTVYYTSRTRPGETMSIFDAAQRYKADGHGTDRVRRQGIRHRLLARLGGQGAGAARRARR
jgi:aconitate hydratase